MNEATRSAKVKRCQIIERDRPTREEPEPKWRFVAHGARYDSDEADATIARIVANGRKTRKLPL